MNQELTKLRIEWKEKDRKYKKVIDRDSFYGVMDGIRNGFSDDNEVSNMFCNIIIPTAESIYIDKDRNDQLEVPFIQYRVGNKVKTVNIIRYHKIIWAILNKYCET